MKNSITLPCVCAVEILMEHAGLSLINIFIIQPLVFLARLQIRVIGKSLLMLLRK
jgi:hypothetical protein